MAGLGPARGSNSAHQEWLIDEALRETFPASDPISPATPPKRRQIVVATDFSATSVAAVDLREGSLRAVSVAVDLFVQAHDHLLYALDPDLPMTPRASAQAGEQLRAQWSCPSAWCKSTAQKS